MICALSGAKYRRTSIDPYSGHRAPGSDRRSKSTDIIGTTIIASLCSTTAAVFLDRFRHYNSRKNTDFNKCILFRY